MRIQGKLCKWNDDRGFGFIAPTHGEQEIFVHISSFPKDNQRPQINEPLSFEIEIDQQGKKRASNVQRPNRVKHHYSSTPKYQKPRANSHTAIKVILGVALIAYGYEKFTEYSSTKIIQTPVVEVQGSTNYDTSSPLITRTEPVLPPVVRQCDGRIRCNQMTSCDEAMFFHSNCPGTKMDGDSDGIPCELEFCNNSR